MTARLSEPEIFSDQEIGLVRREKIITPTDMVGGGDHWLPLNRTVTPHYWDSLGWDLQIDGITEYTVANGVVIEGATLKDGNIEMTDNRYIGSTHGQCWFYNSGGAVTPVGRGGVYIPNYTWCHVNAAVDYGSAQHLLVGNGMTFVGAATSYIRWWDSANAGYIAYFHTTDAIHLVGGTGAAMTISKYGNARLGGSSSQNATSGTNNYQMLAGTAPTEAIADLVYMYAADFAVGNACPYFRTENGTVIGLNQSLLTTDVVTFANVIIGAGGSVQLPDTDNSHYLHLVAGSDLSADRILTFTTGDAARTITLQGNPTLDDWFDQDVKQAASPTFAGLNLGTGELTTGSINRAAGTLTLEIGGATIQSLSATDVTLADGIGLNVYEDITWLGATGENLAKFPDNLLVALRFAEDTNPYLDFISVNGNERIHSHKAFVLTAGERLVLDG